MYGLLTSSFFSISATRRIWTFLNRARCRAAMSWYMASTASARDRARNSLTMLCVPDRESYRSQMAKFFTLSGFFSWILGQQERWVDRRGAGRTTWRATISPLAFLTFFSCRR